MFFRTPQTDDEKRERIDAMYAVSRQHFPEVEGISVRELQRRMDADEVVLIDVRQAQEQEVSTLPGAITSRQFEEDPDRYRERQLVTYCTIGHRSGLYARRLQAAGFKVRNFEGSILAWTHTGRPLADGSGETRRVHVCGPRWSLEASDFEPVW